MELRVKKRRRVTRLEVLKAAAFGLGDGRTPVNGSMTPLGGRTRTVATAGRREFEVLMLVRPRGGARGRCHGPAGAAVGDTTHGARSSLPTTSGVLGRGGVFAGAGDCGAATPLRLKGERPAGRCDAGSAAGEALTAAVMAAVLRWEPLAPLPGSAGGGRAARVATRGTSGRCCGGARRGGGATQPSTHGGRTPFGISSGSRRIQSPDTDCDLVVGRGPVAATSIDDRGSTSELVRTVHVSWGRAPRPQPCNAPPQLSTAAHPAATALRLDAAPSSAPSASLLRWLLVLEGASMPQGTAASEAAAAAACASLADRRGVDRSFTCSRVHFSAPQHSTPHRTHDNRFCTGGTPAVASGRDILLCRNCCIHSVTQ